MTTKVIKQEFVVQPVNSTLPAVTLDDRWSSFMNTYAVWEGSSDSITIRRSIVLQAGNYYVTGAADNSGTVNINGQYNINLYGFGTAISRTSVGNSTLVNHPGGAMTIVISAVNTGGPKGVAVTISRQEKAYISGYGTLPTDSFTLFVGDLVWSTRSPGTDKVGRYVATMPFRASITAHVWGAGGGGGGLDAGTHGGLGASGLYNTTSFEVGKGDIVEVFVGSGGAGGVSSAGSAGGGSPGSSRTSISGDSAKSFNGGSGGRAGSTGSSGGGGAGGGASGVLVNDIPAIVGGGGAGGGGAGNDGNSSSNYSRRDAVITNNATGDYTIGARALNIDNAGSITTSAQTQLVEYNTLPEMTIPPSESGSTKVLGFGYSKSNSPGTFTRTAQTNNKINLASSSVLTFFVRRGSLQTPDSGEDLHLEYSTDGSTWTNITTVSRSVAADTWLIRSPQIPAGAKVAGGVFLRYRQSVTGSDSSNFKDLWAATSIFNGSPTLDFRGENGQDKSGDGGGGGAGGGGYPGGQGGTTPGGDSSAHAGQCGGNFPDNTGTTTGSSTGYYKAGYAGGGDRGSGAGQDGRIVLLITPISLLAVKQDNAWKQVDTAFVKVSDTWKSIDTVYVKVANNWKQISGAGQGDVTLSKNTNLYGSSTRSYT